MSEHFISSIEKFLLAMIDNLVTYFEDKNFKDFITEYGKRRI